MEPTDNEPALIMIDPALGYVKGNTMVVSHKAERLIDDIRREGRKEATRVGAYVVSECGVLVKA
jgi:hypothetical protein